MQPKNNPMQLNYNGRSVPMGTTGIAAQKIRALLSPFQTEISIRNANIQKLDDAIYGDGLIDSVEWMNGTDRTRYNWLERVVDIQTSQLMGRSLKIYSSYEKQDLSIAAGLGDNDQLQQDKMLNSKAKVNADARAKIVRGLIADNGGDELFQTGASSGSAFGFTVYKSWLSDEDADDIADGIDIPWHIEMLENVANYWALWSSDSFRKRDADVYMYQISPEMALQQYGQYLDEGEHFAESSMGQPIGDPNPIAQAVEEGSRSMVTVMEYTGKMTGYKFDYNEKTKTSSFSECSPGDENEGNLLVVGDIEIRIEARPDFLPRYYLIPNRRIQRRPWGFPDITDTCIDINVNFIERMSDWVTISNRALFEKYLGKGYEATSMPYFSPRKITVMPAGVDQSIERIEQNTAYDENFMKLVTELKENFVRSAGISQVLFDNPQLDANSNQALMTSMKGMIDSVERKQKIWAHQLTLMFEDAIRTAAKHYPAIEAFVPKDEDWAFTIKWPSVMRSDDPTTIASNINKFNTGAFSVETFLEEMGADDPSQEIDRLRDEMQDALTAAIRGQRLPLLAEQTINPAPDPTTVPPEVKHTINWAAALTPEQEANLAFTIPKMQDGPFGASMGPQGRLGERANNEQADAGTINGGTSTTSAGVPINTGPDGQPIDPATVAPNGSPAPTGGAAPAANGGPTPGVNSNGGTTAPPVLNGPDNNNPSAPGVMSQPGSGAPATTPAAAVSQSNQNKGK